MPKRKNQVKAQLKTTKATGKLAAKAMVAMSLADDDRPRSGGNPPRPGSGDSKPGRPGSG